MRFLVTAIFFLIAVSGVGAQDGIYLSLSAGQKVFNLQALNDTLRDYSYTNEFKSTFLNYSGEIHFIMGKRFILGGKGFLFSQEQSATGVSLPSTSRKLKIFGDMAIGSLGCAILDESKNGFRLFPQIGIGIAQTNFQVKDGFDLANNANKFPTIVWGVFDSLALVKKQGLVIDACLGMDWDWGFFPSMKCMSGIGCRPLFHAECGYTFVPKALTWMRDSEDMGVTQPDINFGGFYYSIGFGFGFTGAKD